MLQDITGIFSFGLQILIIGLIHYTVFGNQIPEHSMTVTY